MSLNNSIITQSIGIPYQQYVTSSAGHTLVSSSTYFNDTSDNIPRYKDVSGNIYDAIISSSYALTASHALNSGGGGDAFPFTGDAQITGSLTISGSVPSGSVIYGPTNDYAIGLGNDIFFGGAGDIASKIQFKFPGTSYGTGYIGMGSDYNNTKLSIRKGNGNILSFSAGSTNAGIAWHGGTISFGQSHLYLVDSTYRATLKFGNRYGQPATTDGTGVIQMLRGGAPTTNITDCMIIYANDSDGAGTVSPHFRTEDGRIISLGKKSVITGSLIVSSSDSTTSLTLEGSGSTVFNVIGSEGDLFTITDNLTTGSLFAVKDINGFPLLDVTANSTTPDTVTVGQSNLILDSGSLQVTGSTGISGSLQIQGIADVSASIAAASTPTPAFPFTGDAQITGSLKITGLFETDSHITASGNISASGNLIGNTGSFGRTELGKSGALNGSIKFNTLHGPSYELKANNNSLTVSGTTGAPLQGFALDSQVENFSFLDGGTIRVLQGLTTGSEKGGGLHIQAQGANQSNGKKGIFSTDTIGPYIGNSSYGSTGTHGTFRIINGLSSDNDADSGSVTLAEFGDHIKFNLPITASGNISASGDLYARDGRFTRGTAEVEIIGATSEGIIGTETNHDLLLRRFNIEKLRIGESQTRLSVPLLVTGSITVSGSSTQSPHLNVKGDISASGNLIGAGLTLPTFTTNRVPFIGSNGILTTDSGFEYNSTTNQLSVDSLNVIHLTSSFITSSRIHTSGSNIFGDDTTDTQTLIGTTKITGSAQISGSLTFGGAAPTDLYTGGPKMAIDTSAVGGISTKGALLIGHGADSTYTARILLGTTHSGMSFGRLQDSSVGIRGVTQNYAWQLFGIRHGLNSSIYTTNLPDTTFADNLTISGSGTYMSEPLKVHGSGSSVFEVIGTEGTLFAIDDDLDGTIFSANDRSGLPVLEASASGEVYIGKSPQSLYTTAVISSTTANISQSIYGLSTSSYSGVFVDYTANSGSNARAGSIMAIWNGSNLNFTETTTTDIGNTTDLIMQVAISQSQAQIQSYTTATGYKIKTIIKSI